MPLLLLAYPLLIFAAVRWQCPWLGMFALLGLGVHLLWPALVRLRLWALIAMLMLAAAGAWVVATGDVSALLQLAPILIFVLLALFFGRTLTGNSVPLVTRIAAAARDIPADRARQEMAPELWRYTWRVTAFWAFMFLLFAIEDLFMLWLSPPLPWPYLVNVANFVIVLTLLVGEYLYHSRRYPNPKHKNFLDFARDVAQFDYHSLLDD